MTEFNRQAGDIIRRAGRRTAILQLVSIGLLLLLVTLYIDLSSRQENLTDGVQENTMWAVYQLDRETRSLGRFIYVLEANEGQQNNWRDDLLLQFDILYSRADLLNKPGYSLVDTDYHKTESKVDRLLAQLIVVERDIKALVSGKLDISALDDAHKSIGKLEALSNSLLLAANNSTSFHRQKNREDLVSLQHVIGVIVALLLATVALLLVTLKRQLSDVRSAGISIEEMANRLSDAYEAADAGNRAKSQFMATMGHEIRTPLNAILGMAELLELRDLPSDVNENVATIRTSGEALLEVLNEILDYSKIEHGSLELESRAVDVEQLVHSVASMMSGRASERGDRIVVEMPDDLQWPWIETDPTRLRQVLLNLTSNAIKFTDRGLVTIRVHERSGANGAMVLRMEVQDTGIGIDDVGQQKLFKPFSQVDASISRRYGGTGLGLTICKEIVERLGGAMGVESELGAGSIFWFEIPVKVAKETTIVDEMWQDKDLLLLQPLSILVAEDNRVNQQVALRFLEQLGQTADLANNGLEAVQMADQSQYDLILMDMQMPEMDGITATHEIRGGGGMNCETPIVAMTANASEEDRQMCLDAGMNGFESKPISIARLHKLLRECGGLPQDVEPVASAVDDFDYLVGDHSQEATAFSGLDPARRNELVDALGEEIFQELLDSFFNDARNLLDELSTAMASGNEAGVDQALHTIKGAAANVGFNIISELAQSLRNTADDADGLEKLKTIIKREEAANAA